MRNPGVILLAAGGSTRMGCPKQLLPWGKSTLLRHAGETALQTHCRPIIIVLGCEAEACRYALKGLSITMVINNEWKRGLGSSIRVGMLTLEKEAPDIPGVVLMLADQPTVTPSLLETLVARWSHPAWPIVATLYEEGGGVPALFDRTFFPELRDFTDDRGARGLIAREKNRTALIDPGMHLIDLDTPAIYQNHLPK